MREIIKADKKYFRKIINSYFNTVSVCVLSWKEGKKEAQVQDYGNEYNQI